MNFSCVILLALALFGAAVQAYVPSVYSGVEGVGYNGGVCGGGCGAGYGPGYGGMGYGAGYEGGYGCRPACAPVCGPAAVCDTCQCVKTVVRPSVVERIPYCSRRLQSSPCRAPCGMYGNGVYGNGAGYMNGGYVY